MSVDQRVALDLNDLPMDIFELADQGLAVESLTAGHGTPASGRARFACLICCCCSS
jgi:hypothetical protein